MLDRWVHAQAEIATGSDASLAAALRDEGRVIVRNAFAGEARDDGEALVVADTVATEHGVEQVQVRIDVGESVADDGEVSVPLRWQPAATPNAYSSLDGELELRLYPDGTARLEFNARYRIPLGSTHPTALVAATQRLVRRVVRSAAAALGDDPRARAPRPDQLRVADLMTAPPIVLHAEQSLLSATLVLLHHQIAGAPVVDDAGMLIGVFSESDMLAREAAPRPTAVTASDAEADADVEAATIDRRRAPGDDERRRSAQTVGQACSGPATTVEPEASMREAARVLLDHDIGRLVVVSDDNVVGVLSRHDVLRALTRTAEELQYAVELALDELDEPGITVAVDPGSRVHLDGHATSLGHARRAVQIAEMIDGVTGVDSTVEVGVARPPDVYVG